MLEPHGEAELTFLLTWWAPAWNGDGRMAAAGKRYRHMYASRFPDARTVAEQVAPRAGELERRVRAWQEVLYRDRSCPPGCRTA